MTNVNRWTSKGIIGVVLVLLSMLTVLVCTTVGNPPSVDAIAFVSLSPPKLSHQPISSSNASLEWNKQSQHLTVSFKMTGLAPNSTHPAHIHSGSCKNQGAVLYTIPPFTADGKGVVTVKSVLVDKNGKPVKVPGGIPAKGWLINVHNGPDLKPAIQFTPIACADIVNSHTSTAGNQKSDDFTLGAVSVIPNQAAKGSATLSIKNNQLTVIIHLTGLEAKTRHVAHIHLGSCVSQGAVKYPLNPVKADASGDGTSTTIVKNVSSIPTTGWYVNVHLAASKQELGTQSGFDPIACGDV